MSEGNEENDDNLRSLDDLFKAFGDSREDFRNRVEKGEGEAEEEETEEERQERKERERIAALNAAGVSHVLGAKEEQIEIMQNLFRKEKLEDSGAKEDE